MKEEKIQQPDLQRPDLKDPASMLKAQIQWFRHIAPQLQLDPEKLILGKILSDVVGDNNNCFLWAFNGFAYSPKGADQKKHQLLELLQIQVTATTIPPDVAEKIQTVSEEMNTFNWSDKNSFLSAQTSYNESITWLKKRIESDNLLSDAISFLKSHAWDMDPYWCVFLGIRKKPSLYPQELKDMPEKLLK